MKTGYAKLLRAIGQALEELSFQTFKLESDGDDYLVQLRGVRPTWQRLLGRYPATVQVRYTPEDIDRLEREGQARRRDPHGMPDPFSLPQIMRGVGTYVDSKCAQLLKVSRQHQNMVTVQYETDLGKEEERLMISDLYDIWLHMYKNRTSRHARAVASLHSGAG